MSNGLYSNNSGLPTMTRSEYIAEYHDITTYFDEEKARIKKTFPFFLALSIVNVIVEIVMVIVLIPIILDDPFINYRERTLAVIMLSAPCVLSFPLGSLIIRTKQIKKKEQERLDDLENRKKICMDFGTYDAEK
ncbi:MAG: hypothetical protein J6Q50_00365 [Clostridia bacterium]|nr:hypothetical protein [Clostridia bacterium]